MIELAERPGTGLELEMPASWRVGSAINGGFVMAALVRAMERTVGDAARRPRSLSVHFPAATFPGPARVEVEVERAGRGLTTLSARLLQGHRATALALAAFAGDREGPEWHDETMPPAPGPKALAPSFREGHVAPFTGNWDYRAWPGMETPGEMARAVTGGWIRLAAGAPLDAAVIAAMTDAWRPAVLARLPGLRGILPTIDLTVHFRAEPPADEWALVRFVSRVSGGGYFEEDGVLWSQDGRVLAHSRQLATFAGG